MTFSSSDIEKLRERVEKKLSKSRFLHTIGVARAAVRLARLCAPEYEKEVEAAALLHDITKEYSDAEQLRLIREHNLPLCKEDLSSPQILHSYTAPIVIKRDFPEFADEKVLSGVYNHTVGSADMSVFDEIIFLADFIEDGRTHDSCAELREYVWNNMSDGATQKNVKTLHKACVMEIDSTIAYLLKKQRKINDKNLLTKNALLSKI